MIKSQNLYPTMARTSPVVFFYFTILYCILSPSYHSFYLFIIYNSVVGSNWIIKNLIMKPIYNLLGKKSLPILGIGARPPNAESCEFVLDKVIATSFGMPSGHSQIAWTVATYIIFKIIKNWYNTEKDNKVVTAFGYIRLILYCILVLTVAIYISYSRVYLEGCHTIQQFTVGGIIGIVSGFLIYYFEDDAVELMSNIY